MVFFMNEKKDAFLGVSSSSYKLWKYRDENAAVYL